MRLLYRTPIIHFIYLLWGLVLLAACHDRPQGTETKHSAYYWSTTFETDSTQLQFLAQHHVGRIYLRFFDVVMTDGEAMPNATVRFASPIPEGVEVVPTVFIVNDCFHHDTSDLDQKLLGRILQMCETHDVTDVHEIQIDCDWTARTRKAYFAFLQRLRDSAHAKDINISVTIRLHQLADEAPPADHGVLMMYNTGNVADLAHNPILEEDAVKPYLRHIAGYSLPLSTAYPIFEWQLLVRGNHFVGIMHGDDDLPQLPGDTILIREAQPETVIKVKEAVSHLRPDANGEVIIFDMSKNNIQRFNKYHYEKIFNH
ncbi:MAG: hypothetical protein J5637_07590 [Prevotella sp.]|nr:hypothetical protein [Prevotella sp.]